MKVFVYKASLYCYDCAQSIMEELNKEGKCQDLGDEESYDSDDYPKGPYVEGGGEADSPQHCDECGVFLENPLTIDGTNYLLDEVIEFLNTGKGDAVEEWIDYYDVDLDILVRHAKTKCSKQLR